MFRVDFPPPAELLSGDAREEITSSNGEQA
jgi:hypothetical protein